MFFDATPNFLYPDFKVAGKFKLSKNIFRRVRARDSFNAVYASSKKYTINPGETPDSIAESELGSNEWYWTILILNNIINIHQQWPLDNDELDRYVLSKYGTYADSPKYWETSEVKNAAGEIVLPAGQIIEYYNNTTEQNQTNYIPQVYKTVENLDPGDLTTFTKEPWSFTYIYSISQDGTKVERTVTGEQNLTEITNREYEYQLNELKREIYLPKTSSLPVLDEEIKNLLKYETSYKITDEGYRLPEDV